MYLVTERMDSDLNAVIRSDETLSDDHVKYFLYQILCGIKCAPPPHACRTPST